MRISTTLILAVTVFMTLGCRERKAEQFKALPFPDVIPPEMLEDPQDRAEYLAEHWWDRFTDAASSYPCDSLLINGVKKGDVEQAFANWTRVLSISRYSVASRAVVRLYERAAACEARDTASNVFEQMTEIVSRYLFDPNSPMRNEDFYGPYAEKLSTSEFVDDDLKVGYAYDARMCALNRTGTKAADFRFSDKRGHMHTLYGMKSELILLFFSNPGCTACKEIIDVLSNDPVISGLIEDGTMSVLNIYIDEDLEAWRSYMPIYPETWYNGFDPDLVIRGETLYNVRAIPSLYLLDKDKRVIMKDAPEERIFQWLSGYRR